MPLVVRGRNDFHTIALKTKSAETLKIVYDALILGAKADVREIFVSSGSRKVECRHLRKT